MNRFARRCGAALVAVSTGLAGLLVPAAPAQAATFTVLRNRVTQLVIAPTTLADRSPLVQRRFNSTDRQQQWRRVTDGSDTRFILRARIAGPNGAMVNGCLDLASDADRAQQVSGERLVIRACDGTASQAWRVFVVPNGPNGEFNLENKLARMSVDVRGQSRSEFAAIVQNASFALTQDWLRTDAVTG